ncbi:hypothetical protein DN757_20720 [Paenibacillus silvae]|uniref:SLH domain-containing protein n=2 Tax=Paenibacillus silvae TaxID=1325358 RepID=A0A2W6NDC9_9BACL|nr:hypothetical protein DN757_20720 [Paenibacillus silvae]
MVFYSEGVVMSKQVRKSISALLVFALVLQVFAVTSVHAEGELEVQDKKITTKVGLNEIQLSWVEAASDSPEDLMYSIYMSDQANIDTVSNAEKNGTKIRDLQNGSSSFKVDNLTSGAKYYFNIVASDINSKIAYSMEEVSTLSSSAQAPSVTADDEANVIIGAKNTMEYSVNEGADWQDYDTTEPPIFNGNAAVWVRVKASNSESASQHKVLTFTENTETNSLDSLNLAKSKGDISGVLAALQNPNLGILLPQGFNLWSDDEKQSVAEFVTLINGSTGYVSKGQVQYALDIAIEPRSLFDSNDLLTVEQNITAYFGNLAYLPQVFGANTDESIQALYELGEKYTNLSSVEKQIFAYRIMFYAKRDGLPPHKIREQLDAILSTYSSINRVIDSGDMHNVLIDLRLIQKESTDYNNDPDTIEKMTTFSLDLDKIDPIEYETEQELAQWMIDHRPETGYADYQAIQETFDAFFNPVKDPLKELNTAKSEQNLKTVLLLIKQPEWLDLPEGFESLQSEEQEIVAQIVMTFIPSDYDYQSKGEVQYALRVGYEGLMAALQTDSLLFQQHLISFYSLVSQANQYISYPDTGGVQIVSQKYSKLSSVDKQLISYIAQRFSQDDDFAMKDAYVGYLMLLLQYPPINEPTTPEEMLGALQMIYGYQNSSEELTPYEKFPLDFSKLDTITENETKREQLAKWMIAKKPVGGYTSYEEIQKAFNAFFAPPSDPTTPGSSTGSGSGGGGSSTPVPTTKQEQIVVDVNGVNGTNLTKTPITRTTEANGVVKDLVKMTDMIAKQSVEKAKQLGTDTARIVIPDAKDAVSETRVEVPKTAVKELSDGSLKLEISTANAVISVPAKSIAGFDQELYFRIVPLKKESERKEIEDRAKKEQIIQQAAPNANVRVLARPVEIETNMQGREVTLTLPLGNSLPTETAARQQALSNLAVYIEHSDDTKELVRGKLVKLADSSEAIEFTVTKFSTFTLVSVDGLNAAQTANHPYIQGFGADFRPDAFVTRAQMAAMLARNLSGEAATASSTAASFADVAATHWAAKEIEEAQAAGIMNGLSSSVFGPEGSITRAQMATIAYRWLQKQEANAGATETASATPATSTTASAAFTDVPADLWAADAIAYVQSAGLMTGYQDGTFKPEGKLTRAEAVKVLNVLFKRTPLTGEAEPSFNDVPATHWAYADIEAAAQK